MFVLHECEDLITPGLRKPKGANAHNMPLNALPLPVGCRKTKPAGRGSVGGGVRGAPQQQGPPPRNRLCSSRPQEPLHVPRPQETLPHTHEPPPPSASVPARVTVTVPFRSGQRTALQKQSSLRAPALQGRGTRGLEAERQPLGPEPRFSPSEGEQGPCDRVVPTTRSRRAHSCHGLESTERRRCEQPHEITPPRRPPPSQG